MQKTEKEGDPDSSPEEREKSIQAVRTLIKEKIKEILDESGENYRVRIQNPKTGKERWAPPIPRNRMIEDMCYERLGMWPIQLYAGVRAAELDPDNLSAKKARNTIACVTEVIVGMLNYCCKEDSPDVGLADVETVLRRGDCATYIVARKIPATEEVTPFYHNHRGERCEWYYDVSYTGEVTEFLYERFQCSSSLDNMERLKRAGHIFVNHVEWKASAERSQKKHAKITEVEETV